MIRTHPHSSPDEAWRADGYREMVAFLRSKHPLREGLTDERATDAMLFLASPGAYRALVDDRGWTHAEWVAWTSRVLASSCSTRRRSGIDRHDTP